MKCYICNKELTERDNLSEAEKKTMATTHYEHIIHNAILGRLVSNKILCKKCGNDYSFDDDSSFTSLFNPFVERLENFDVYHRRATNSVRKLGYLHTISGVTNVEVVEKDGEVYNSDMKNPPYEIDEENKSIIVIASPLRVKNFKMQFIGEHPAYSDYNFISKDYLSSGNHIAYFFSEKNPNFNNQFKKGFVKIGLEFALDCGVSREYISEALSIDTEGKATVVYDNVPVIPYMALSCEESEYEKTKISKRIYPQHLLRLYDVQNPNDTRSLVCYVELFSTFQYFVILSSNYSGSSVDYYYGQRIFREYENGKELQPCFDFKDYLKNAGLNPENFKKYTFDEESKTLFPTVWICKGACMENWCKVQEYTNMMYHYLELFLWG